MLYSRLTALRWLLPASFLAVGCSQGPDQAKSAAAPEPPTQMPGTQQPAAADPMPKLLGGWNVLPTIQEGIVLPFGTPVPDTSSQVVVSFVVGTLGEVADEKIVQGLDSVVDEAVLTAVRNLPTFEPTVRNGKSVRVPCMLTIKAPGVATAAQRQEADTRWRRTARRRPGETDSSFVRRVLPLSSAYGSVYDFKLMTYAWRPSAYGKQLFFAQRGGADNEYGTDLFVLDPYQPDTYAVQVIPVETMGDQTDLEALFFADANHDGRPELLTLAVCALREQHRSDDGELLDGHWNHYSTDVWQYAGPDPAGRPQYRRDLTPRPYLDELPTAAAVRQALARHRGRPRRPK